MVLEPLFSYDLNPTVSKNWLSVKFGLMIIHGGGVICLKQKTKLALDELHDLKKWGTKEGQLFECKNYIKRWGQLYIQHG